MLSRYKQISVNSYFIGSLAFLSFAIPFGFWQDQILHGLTVPKIAITLSTMLFAYSLAIGMHQKIRFYLPWVLFAFFLLFISPSLASAGMPGLQMLGLFCGYGALMLLAYNCLWKPDDLLFLLKVYGAGLAIVVFLVMLAFLNVFDAGIHFGQSIFIQAFNLPRLLGTEENPNAFAVYFIAAIPLSIAMLKLASARHERVFWSILGLLCFLCLSLTASRSAALGTFMAMQGFFYLNGPINWKRTLLYTAILPLSVAAAFYLPNVVVTEAVGLDHSSKIVQGTPEQTLLLRDKSQSIKNRIEFFPVAFDIARDNLLWGVGYDGLENALTQYQTEQKSAHNIFLDVLLLYGVPAALLFFSFTVWMFFDMTRTVISTQNPRRRAMYALVLSIMGGLLVNGMFHTSQYSVLFWMFVALCLSAIRQAKPRNAASYDIANISFKTPLFSFQSATGNK